MRSTKIVNRLRATLPGVLFFAVVAVLILNGLFSAREAQRDEQLRVLDDSLRRAVVCCYAIEGQYPDTLEYLTDNYGVYIDSDRYTVHYSVFASNVMPDITILEKS